MKTPILFRRTDTLTPEQALYWKDLLYRTVKIGTELEFALPKGARKEEALPALTAALQPTGDMAHLGPLGIFAVVSEHCGIELQIIGRQPYFPALVEQYRQILALIPPGSRARPTCGLHFHALAPALAEPLPEIVLANLWNLVRRYAPELRFLTSGGDALAALCRRRNYASHLEMVKLSPVPARMPAIQAALKASLVVPEHNNFLNLEHVRFDAAGDARVFHVEFRFPDADLTAHGIAAKTFLFLALVLKAVELAQHGVIHVGRIVPWRRKCELLDLLSNNDGPLATSDTGRVTQEVLEELRAGTRELLELLKPLFGRLARTGEGGEEHAAFEILNLLAETPVSLLRASGRDWAEIERLLAERAATTAEEWDANDRQLIRAIELAELTGYGEPEAWKWTAARELYLTPQELERRLARLDGRRGLKWDARLGAMVFLS